MLFITHDLALADLVCSRVCVMYAGRIAEMREGRQIFENPLHPYTIDLLAARPTIQHRVERLPVIKGVPTSAMDAPLGCPFHPAAALSWTSAARLRQRWCRCAGVSSAAFGPTRTSRPCPPPAKGRCQMGKTMLLKVEKLYKDFRLRSGLLGRSSRLQAVKDISFLLPASGSLAIVGETGSGKTTVARIVVGLEKASSGTVEADGIILSPQPGPDERRRRARMMQMVFQNPVMSLDPHQSIGAAIHEVVSFHGLRPPSECDARVTRTARRSGLGPETDQEPTPEPLRRPVPSAPPLPRSLAAEPELLVLDEPVSALDVSTQAQILNLLADLKARLGISLLTISHDLALVRQLADDVIVMCKGEMVEAGSVDDVLSRPQHAYTRRLVDAVPEIMGRSSARSASVSDSGASHYEDA